MASTDLGDSVGNNFDLTPDIETTIYFSNAIELHSHMLDSPIQKNNEAAGACCFLRNLTRSIRMFFSRRKSRFIGFDAGNRYLPSAIL